MNQIRSTRGAAALIVGSLLVATACNGYSTGPATDPVVQTAENVYEIPAGSYSLIIDAMVTNTLDETLLLDGIARDFRRLEKLVGGSWRVAYTPVFIMPLVPDIELPPGAVQQLKMPLYVGNDPNTFPKFEFEIPGTYRGVFRFRTSGSRELTVYSNDFELRLAQ